MGKKSVNFYYELLTRMLSFLTPKKIALILGFAVLSGFLGFGFGELFLKKEYRTEMTLAIEPEREGKANVNLSDAHHVADIFEALYDNDDVVKLTLSQVKSNRTQTKFVENLRVVREEKTVLVKMSYTDDSKDMAVKTLNAYYKNLCQAITLNLGYNSFLILSPPSEPSIVSHTQTAVVYAVLIELLIAIAWIVIRVFPGIIIVTGADFSDFEEPVLGELFLHDVVEEENDEEMEKEK